MAEDYERTNALEWGLVINRSANAAPAARGGPPLAAQQDTSPQRRQGKGGTNKAPLARRPVPKLMQRIDNVGEHSWRSREAPKDSIRIPDVLALQDQTHITVARYYGAFIFSDHKAGFSGSKTYGIWGDDEAVLATRKTINGWIEEFHASKKSTRAEKFPKIQSLTPVLREDVEKKWRKEVKRHRFRQCPPPETMFGAVGSFHWPIKEYRPEEILGMSYEALDPIRMGCSCYVVFIKDRSLFQIMGKSGDVQEALMRLRGTCFQIAARQIEPVRTYMLSSLATGVKLGPYLHPNATIGDRDVDIKHGNSPYGTGMKIDSPEIRAGLNEERIQISILTMLRKLHYYHGSIQMRIRLGTFLVTQYKAPQDGLYAFEEFENMLGASQFKGEVTRELGDKTKEDNALARFHEAGDLLAPQDAMTRDIMDVKPIYSAVFTFANEAGDLRLSMSWVETQDATSNSVHYEPIANKWTRLERDAGGASSLLDISLTDLNDGRAWQFDIEATQSVDKTRLPKPLIDFAHSVRIDPKEARKANSNQSFVMHKPYIGHLKSIQQRISYRYYLIPTDYTMELTRFQNRSFPPRRSAILAAGEATVYEPRWGLQVWRGDWDKEFTKNENLAVGEKADWEHDAEMWFPEGFQELMHKLEDISRLMKKMDGVEDLVGGMTIG